jgi:very-short-patch-repair endonuclease
VLTRKVPLRPRATLENRLWARLRLLGFRRRATFKSFTLDFVAHDVRLVVSLEDGQPGRSKTGQIARDRLLNEAGYVILRLWRSEAEQDMGAALSRIKTVLADLSAHES